MFKKEKQDVINVEVVNPENAETLTADFINKISADVLKGIHGSSALHYRKLKPRVGNPVRKKLSMAVLCPKLFYLKNCYVNWQMVVFDEDKNVVQKNLTSHWEWDDVAIPVAIYKSKILEKLLKIFSLFISEESQFILRKKEAFKQYSCEVFSKKQNRIEEIEEALVFNDQYWFVFGHFITDHYPRLYFALLQLSDERRSNIKIIIPPKRNFHYTDRNGLHNSFIESCLDSFGIREEQKIYMQEDVILKIKNLILPSAIRFHPIIKESLKYFCNYFDDFISYPQYERLYISRRNAQRRKVVNEEEMITLLEKHGFKSVVIEEYDFKTQINILKNAKIVIAPDSSSITNVVLCNCEKFLILTVKSATSIFYSTMTDVKAHYFQFCEPENKKDFVWYSSNLVVDLDELEKNLVKLTE